VILLSGGIDSTALLAEYHDTASLALFVDYGQPSRVEEEACARRSADRFDVPFQKVTVGPIQLGPMDDDPGVSGPRVIPGRNALLISIAANYAGIGGEVLIGSHRDDFDDYHDCHEQFFFKITAALAYAQEAKVRAPFGALPKSAVRAKLAAVSLDASGLCWSCYAPVSPGVPCGACNSCKAAR
jgi:7-cyano-7-deazaguanine synthase